MKNKKKNILLNPGPANTTNSVKHSQIVPDICPREKEFGDVLNWVCKELTKFVANKNDYATILFGGSGTAAIESIISSVISKDDRILIMNNGEYGKRAIEIASIYGLDFLEFKSPVNQPINLDLLNDFINHSFPKITHLFIVHNETTTGILNDIKSVGLIAGENNIIFIVDAMSSFGAIPINMEKMNIGYLAASSNKNIQGMAGVSFVIASKKELKKIKKIKHKNLYLNLYAQYDYFKRNNQTRFTPPVQTIYALKQAIEELKKEGVKNRYKRYSNCWEILISGLSGLGLNFVVPIDHHSKIITAVYEPDNKNYNFNKMHDFLYKKGITIYPGKVGNMKTFRVANIGDISSKDVYFFLKEIKKYFKSIE